LITIASNESRIKPALLFVIGQQGVSGRKVTKNPAQLHPTKVIIF